MCSWLLVGAACSSPAPSAPLAAPPPVFGTTAPSPASASAALSPSASASAAVAEAPPPRFAPDPTVGFDMTCKLRFDGSTTTGRLPPGATLDEMMRKQRIYTVHVDREIHGISNAHAFVIAFDVPFQTAELNGLTATQQLMDVDGHAYRFDGATLVELPNKPVRANQGMLVAWQSALAVAVPQQLPPGPITKGPVDPAVAHALTVFLTPMSTYLEVGGKLEPKASEASITEPVAPGATDQALLVHKGAFATGSGEDVTLTSQAWLHHGDGRLIRLVAEGVIEPREGRSKTEGNFQVDMKCAYEPLASKP